MCPFNNWREYTKDFFLCPKFSRHPDVACSDTLLVLTDAIYKSKDRKSSYGYVLIMRNSGIGARTNFMPRLSSSKDANKMAILFALKEASAEVSL